MNIWIKTVSPNGKSSFQQYHYPLLSLLYLFFIYFSFLLSLFLTFFCPKCLLCYCSNAEQHSSPSVTCNESYHALYEAVAIPRQCQFQVSSQLFYILLASFQHLDKKMKIKHTINKLLAAVLSSLLLLELSQICYLSGRFHFLQT